ncbi:MAG: DUF2318 domain-containing protein [Clostridiales bacterium]|nr:DUF2318 domain-containing protein [Clostridiales bacterium]
MAQNMKQQGKAAKVTASLKWKPIISIAIVCVAAIVAIAVILNQKPAESQPGTAAVSAVKDAGIVIPVGDISEKATFYPAEIDGTSLEVIAVKASDGTTRIAFNTCQVCYSSGRGYYEQDGGVLVCQNCGNRFATDQVGIKSGGCNPWPIFEENIVLADGNITIPYDFLKESKQIFANWKL